MIMLSWLPKRGSSCAFVVSTGWPVGNNPLDDRPANRELGLVERFLFPVPGDVGDQLAGFVAQHQETPLCFHQTDDVIHHHAQNFI